MTVTQATTSIEQAPAAALEQVTTEVWERPLDETPNWPVTRLASWSLTLLLAAGLYIPAVIGEAHGIRLLLLPPVVVTTMTARALFEALGFATDTRSLLGHAAAAIPPALVAGVLMAAACGIVRPPWSPLIGITAAVFSTVTLAAAGVLRGVEIRLRRGLRRVYFVGSPECLHDLQRELAHHEDRQLVGATTLPGREDSINRASLVADAIAAQPTVLVLDSDAMQAARLADAGSPLGLIDVGVRDLVSYYEQEFKKVPLGELTSSWFEFDIAPTHRRRTYASLRRALEPAVAAALLIAASPMILLVAAAIRVTSRGPALYRQRRVGNGGRPFTLLKLRTMTEDAGDAAAWASSQAHRVTPVGRYLRRFRVDELPQLWNVLRGDLALIGPRPEQAPIVERLARELPYYNARHCIRPGMTGWAQVSLGYGGSVEGALAKLQRDLYYVKHSSLRLDALIVWLTLKTVLAGRG